MMSLRSMPGNPLPARAALLSGAQPIAGLVLESPIPLIQRNIQRKPQI
jgi:hypothetical protein